MTEGEWLASTDPAPMLAYLQANAKASDRKQRLFIVACLERSTTDQSGPQKRSPKLAQAEQFADREITLAEFQDAFDFRDVVQNLGWARMARPNPFPTELTVEFARDAAAGAAVRATTHHAANEARAAARIVQVHLLRDIFGNPFRPLPPRPEAIAPLAEQIYAGAWDKMPLLGEWLQEHGYWSEGEHCLDPQNHHVKGCWVIDWVTDRE